MLTPWVVRHVLRLVLELLFRAAPQLVCQPALVSRNVRYDILSLCLSALSFESVTRVTTSRISQWTTASNRQRSSMFHRNGNLTTN